MELTEIKGIGESRKKSFEENGIFSCEDLINYFPYKYYDFTKTEAFADDGKVRLIKATAIENPKIVKAKGNLSFVICKMNDETGHTFQAVWFNQTFIKSQLYLGITVFLYGKNSPKKKNTFNVLLMKKQEKLNEFGLLPVYHSIDGIGQTTILDSINKSLEMLNISSFLPYNILLKHNILNLSEAYKTIHSPKNFESLSKAQESIEVEELLPVLAANKLDGVRGRQKRDYNYKNITNLKDKYLSLLPFVLTKDQIAAIDDIIFDFSNSYSMNRLLQGDVGSGKTVVSFFGAFIAAENGFQSTIIAPTEILAKQHFETAKKIFANTKLNIALLTKSSTALERREILSSLENGKIDLLIGTHSILSSDVIFKNLSYSVIDEQHRFGVAQRAMIKQKGTAVDVLVMSATPIPRSLALVVYGNLDFSTIHTRPNATNITTNIVIKQKQNDMWKYIKNKISSGSKVYVVCSKIDEENEDDDVLMFSAKNMFDYLCTIFDKQELGLIHGKLKKDTQNKVIENFRLGKIKILVSTTIVEVGVDVPDSDIMVISSPERFGLATLHQLRGRIGRNGKESHCFCLANNLNEHSFERVNYFRNHLNGFEIAEFDLKTRGAGTMFGTNQHGADNGLISNFSAETYTLAQNIFNDIKDDEALITKLANIYTEKHSKFSKNNIVLN
ncbi:MAG: ATP-dependent DNA helicase RecG [Clostridia bacterium]|nr:ATP-dependent DNA helicase RecG [Clostridia bacterium]